MGVFSPFPPAEDSVMRWLSMVLTALAAGGAARAADPPKPQPLSGWYGAFPRLGLTGYHRTFTAPVVAKGDKPTEYRQTVKYEWTGGAAKHLEVTLARDPAFKKKYAPDALKKEDPAPKEVKVGKRNAWLWTYEPKAGDDWPLVGRVVLPLGEEAALILEAKGQGPWESLTGLVEKFDADRMAEAVKAPPRTDFGRSPEAFAAIKKGGDYADVLAWVGEPDADVGSGIHVLAYKLADGSRVLVGTPDFKTIQYVKHERKDGKTEDLAK
jgi:hypothetical protein